MSTSKSGKSKVAPPPPPPPPSPLPRLQDLAVIFVFKSVGAAGRPLGVRDFVRNDKLYNGALPMEVNAVRSMINKVRYGYYKTELNGRFAGFALGDDNSFVVQTDMFFHFFHRLRHRTPSVFYQGRYTMGTFFDEGNDKLIKGDATILQRLFDFLIQENGVRIFRAYVSMLAQNRDQALLDKLPYTPGVNMVIYISSCGMPKILAALPGNTPIAGVRTAAIKHDSSVSDSSEEDKKKVKKKSQKKATPDDITKEVIPSSSSYAAYTRQKYEIAKREKRDHKTPTKTSCRAAGTSPQYMTYDEAEHRYKHEAEHHRNKPREKEHHRHKPYESGGAYCSESASSSATSDDEESDMMKRLTMDEKKGKKKK